MKPFLTMLITSFSALLPISNLTSNINNSHSEKIASIQNTNESAFTKDDTINKLDILYKKRSTNSNLEIKNNLVSSIILNNNKININYKNLNKNLYYNSTYKFLKGKDYLKSLEVQYQMHQIKFNANKHIIFGDDIHLLQFSGIWFESHWYWYGYGYWRLHLDSNRCQQLINTIGSATRIASGASAVALIASLLTNWEVGFLLEC